MTEKRKQPLTAQEKGVEIQRHEAEYYRRVKEDIKLIELQSKEVETSKSEAIIARGADIIRWRLVDTDKICAKLKRDFKGTINPKYIHDVIHEAGHTDWLQTKFTHKSYKGKTGGWGTPSSVEREPVLSKQEQEFLQTYKDQRERDKNLLALLQSWTGKHLVEQAKIISETPKGSDWRKTLVEKSNEYMLRASLQMSDTQVIRTLNDLRTLQYVAEKLGEMLYEQHEVRQTKNQLASV